MPKYKVTTEKGTYIVETQEAAPAQGGVTDNRTASEVRRDQANAVIGGIGDFFTGLPAMAGAVGGAAMDAFATGGMQRNVDRGMAMLKGVKDTAQPLINDTKNLSAILADRRSDIPQSTPQQQQGYANAAGQFTAPLLGGIAIDRGPDLVKALADRIPSKASAGDKFGQVMAQAKDIPLNLSEADDAALRAQELAGRGAQPGRGSSLPKVMRDYLRTRENSPSMTYEAGRDFQTAAGRLSSAEAQSTNPVMKAQISKLAKALAESNREAAVKAGVGNLYDQAMAEYRSAAQLADMKDALVDVLKRHGAKAAIGTGIGYGLYKAVDH